VVVRADQLRLLAEQVAVRVELQRPVGEARDDGAPLHGERLHRLPHRERQPLFVERRMNAVWALDFMRDTLYSGRVFRTVNAIDEANRGALGIDIAVSIPAARVITFLTQMIDLHGMT